MPLLGETGSMGRHPEGRADSFGPRHPRGPPPPAAVAESRACPLPACLTSHPFFIPSQAEAARLPAWPPWALRLPRALTPPPWGPGAWKRAGCRCWELARGLSVRRRD